MQSDFQDGYDAAASCLPLDKTKSKKWQSGWWQYQRDLDKFGNTPY